MLRNKISNESFKNLLNDLEESIYIWQKKQKEKLNDKRFNAKTYLAGALGYKDEKILYRFLDPNDNSAAKIGIEDVEIIVMETGDITPLENYIESLKQEVR